MSMQRMHMLFTLPVCWVFSAVAICDLHAHCYCRQPLSSTLLCSKLMTAGLQLQESWGTQGNGIHCARKEKTKELGVRAGHYHLAHVPMWASTRNMHFTLPVPVCRVLSRGNVRPTCIHFDADSQCSYDLHLYLVSLYTTLNRYAMNVALPWWASGLNPEKHRHCNSPCTATNARTPFVYVTVKAYIHRFMSTGLQSNCAISAVKQKERSRIQ